MGINTPPAGDRVDVVEILIKAHFMVVITEVHKWIIFLMETFLALPGVWLLLYRPMAGY